MHNREPTFEELQNEAARLGIESSKSELVASHSRLVYGHRKEHARALAAEAKLLARSSGVADTTSDGVKVLQAQLVRARDAWSRYDRLGGRVKDAQDLDVALDLKFEREPSGVLDTADNKVKALQESVAGVLALHVPFEWSFGFGPVKSCKECARLGGSEADAQWPCPTMRALGVTGE